MVILSIPVESFNAYRDDPRQVLEPRRRCPRCETRGLSHHGHYGRWVYYPSERVRISLFRLRCRPCGLTLTLLPDCLVPYGRYALSIIETALGAYLDTPKSYRAVALAITGVEVGTDVSATDALLWTRLTPAFQRIHAWIDRLCSTASRDVQEITAWLLRRVPTTLAADLLTVPSTTLSAKSPHPLKRKAIEAARLVPRLFTLVPQLDPLHRGWGRAWSRFASSVLHRCPWRGPPAREPQSP